MRTLSFHMPAYNGAAFDLQLRQLKELPQPATGSVRVVRFAPDPHGDFAQLDITYMKGSRILMRYEAFMSLVEFKNPKIEFPFYRFISAQYMGERDEDFGRGDVGPFYQLHQNPLFHHLNPNWAKKFRTLADLEIALLNEDVRSL